MNEPDDRTRTAPAGVPPAAFSDSLTPASSGGASTQVQHAAPTHLFGLDALPAVPGYAVLHEIARGGMGVVYAAHDPAFDREVAIKVMHPGQDAERFVIESKVTAQLPHPGVPPVYALGTLSDGRPFLAMKLIHGRTLAKELQTPDLPRLLGIFEQICQTVGFAHSRGIVHRDLKPANVMVGAFGEVQVMDWGLAKSVRGDREAVASDGKRDAFAEQAGAAETVAGQVKGTPAYMAPEQARGEPVEARADVFALGGILAATLTGRPPFRGSSVLDTVLKAAEADLGDCLAALDACGADAELTHVAKKCLAANAADRYSTGEDVAAAVAAYRAGVEQRLRTAERERAVSEAEAREQRKRRKVQLALAAVTLLLLMAGGGFAWWRDHQTTAARIEVEKRQSLTEQEVASALAEMATLCDRGDRELDNPPRWRLTLAAARAAHRRAAAALDTGSVSDEVREKFHGASARLERDEADCGTAEACEKWLVALLKVLGGGGDVRPHLDALDAEREAILTRAGLSPPGEPEAFAGALRRHHLRYQLTALLLCVPESGKLPSRLLTPQLRLAVARDLHPLLPTLIERAKRTERFGAASEQRYIDTRAVVAQLREGEGRMLSSTEILCMSFYVDTFKPMGRSNDLTYLVEEAYRRNPADLFATAQRVIIKGLAGEGGQSTAGPDGVPVTLLKRLRPWPIKPEEVFVLDPAIQRRLDYETQKPQVLDGDVEAIGVCASATSRRPDVPTFWLFGGMTHAGYGFFELAVEYYREALRLDSTSEQAHYGLADALQSDGQTAEALDVYRITIQRFGRLTIETKTDVRVRAAQAAIRVAQGKDVYERPTDDQKRELRREALCWLREWLTYSPTARDVFVVKRDPAFEFIHDPERRKDLPADEARRWDSLQAEVSATRVAGDDRFAYWSDRSPTRQPVVRESAPLPRAAKDR